VNISARTILVWTCNDEEGGFVAPEFWLGDFELCRESPQPTDTAMAVRIPIKEAIHPMGNPRFIKASCERFGCFSILPARVYCHYLRQDQWRMLLLNINASFISPVFLRKWVYV